MIIGIDLGTTNSSVCTYINGEIKLIPNSFGKELTPSIVSFDEDGTYYVGEIAKDRLSTHPRSTFKEFKRNMGTNTQYTAFEKRFKAEDLSALVLKQLKEDAERFTGEEITEAVISVPAYFTDSQRAATRNAGIIAGLNVKALINEPSAASLFYHMKDMEQDKKFIVFDFGGGTLDATLVDAFDNIIEIQGISGDNQLGGMDFNMAICHDICAKASIAWGGLTPDKKAIVLKHAEAIKMQLSESEDVYDKIILPNREIDYYLNRQGLLDISEDIFARITIVLKRLMNDAMIGIDDIDGVIMVGGSSHMPVVQLYINTLFKGRARFDENADIIVALGAGTFAAVKDRKTAVKDMILTDIAPFSLGIEANNGEMIVIIPKNRVLPCSMEKEFFTTHDNQKFVSIDIYQGEGRMVYKNQRLHSFNVEMIRKPAGEAVITVRFSYDLNGIFDVDITGDVLSDSNQQFGNISGLNTQELEKKRALIDKLKTNGDDEEAAMIITRAETLYTQCNELQKMALGKFIQLLQEALDSGHKKAIMERKKSLFKIVERIEANMFAFAEFDGNLWSRFIDNQIEIAKESEDSEE